MLDFGIEIEFLIPHDNTQASVATAITAAGVETINAGYGHTFEPVRWKVVSDGSLRPDPGYYGMELVSPPLNEGKLDQIEKVSAVLLSLGAKVNRSTGLHVHVEARRLPFSALKKLAALYIENETLIDQLLPPSRRGSNNNYTRSNAALANIPALIRATNVNDIASAVQGGTGYAERYRKLNFHSFWRHGTVEFRHHSGTIEAAKIIKWVTFVTKLVDVAVLTANEPITVPAGSPNVRYSPYVDAPIIGRRVINWRGPQGRRGRQLHLLGQMIIRTEGVTNEELRTALGIRSRPGIRAQLARVGVPVHVIGRRGGYEIFRLSPLDNAPPSDAWNSVEASIPAPMTLDQLYEKLGLSDEDKAFWAERVARLADRNNREVHNP